MERKIKISGSRFIYLSIFFFFTCYLTIQAQEYDVVHLLKKIESGGINDVRNEVKSLLIEFPSDPSVQFVDALTTENAEQAVTKYITIFQKYPQSRYEDAALFRAYSFYYATGSYRKAQEYLFKLQKEYPNSPYLKAAERDIPSVEDSQVSMPAQKTVENLREQNLTGVDYKFTVQAGAFTNFSNANSLKTDLEDSGLHVEIKEKTVGGTLFYVVLAGKFVDRDSASKEADKINTEFRLDSKIIPITK